MAWRGRGYILGRRAVVAAGGIATLCCHHTTTWADAAQRIYSRDEVSRHNRQSSAWIVIDSKVFDVSSFLRDHPGGRNTLMQYAGQDATGAFHSMHAPEVLKQVAEKYVIGVVEEPPKITSHPCRSTTSLAVPDQSPAQPTGLALAAGGSGLASASDESGGAARPREIERLTASALSQLPSLAAIEAAAVAIMPSSLRLYVGYGAEDEVTVHGNTSGWSQWILRPRVLANATAPQTTCKVLGCEMSMPVLVAPFAAACACHPEGEAAIARAVGTAGSGYVVPHFGGTPLQEVTSLDSTRLPT
jgi:L-lactate dehydrogenase (cytochrome)